MKNKKLKDLCEQAGMECSLGHWYITDENLESFAELIRQEHDVMDKQALTDPENQPSQYGTVTIEYMEQQIKRQIDSKERT